jgi:hypothetical protein
MAFVDPSKFYFWLGSDQEVYYHADGTDTPIRSTEVFGGSGYVSGEGEE